MLKLVEFDENLNLQSFYDECTKRGLVNNNSQDRIYDSFKRYEKFKTWIMFKDDSPIGSVVAHSFEDYKPNSYRILARTCVLSDKSPLKFIRTIKNLKEHQHIMGRYYVPKCIEFCGVDSEIYMTTHPENTGTMKAVHKILMKVWGDKGLVEKVDEIYYRNSLQTVWKVNGRKLLDDIKKYPPNKLLIG